LQTRDDLTHMIVHDLRSPLTTVTGYVDALEQMASDKLNPDEAMCVAEAKRGAVDMRDMITTLLDVSRLEAGEMPLRLQDYNLAEIAREAANRFTPVLRGRTLRCEVPAEPVSVSCDGHVIRRILENLISNALKFTKSTGTIRVRVQSNAAAATLSVSDDGEGIPREQHKHVFEKFGQTDSGGKHRHSTGLGLAFCRLAVEAHHGKIGLASEPGKGSTFWFTLPVREHAAVKKNDGDQTITRFAANRFDKLRAGSAAERAERAKCGAGRRRISRCEVWGRSADVFVVDLPHKNHSFAPAPSAATGDPSPSSAAFRSLR